MLGNHLVLATSPLSTASKNFFSWKVNTPCTMMMVIIATFMMVILKRAVMPLKMVNDAIEDGDAKEK